MSAFVRALISVAGGLAGAALGLVAGATHVGNHAVDFEFAGGRGAEAGAMLGALVGLFGLGALTYAVLGLFSRRTQRS